MRWHLLAIIVGIPLAWHLALTAVAYYDAGRVGLEPRAKWAAITFLIPLFGFFIYLFERSELDYDPAEDPYRGNKFNIHPSRADDSPLPSRGDDRIADGEREQGDREGDERTRRDRGERDGPASDDRP
ncbi:PLD nuclease N-terminal domain-containing protein [Halopiger thermotolerans]